MYPPSYYYSSMELDCHALKHTYINLASCYFLPAPTGPPTNFHVVVLNSTGIEIQWNLPPYNLRNGIIRGFKLFVQPEGQGEEQVYTISNNETDEYIVGRLTPSTAYVCSILAYTIADGPRSIHLTVITRESSKYR